MAHLTHTAADVVAQYLINVGLGSSPLASPAQQWPVYVGNEPSSPDNLITVYSTAGRMLARHQHNGEWTESPGFMIRVRGTTRSVAGHKAREIAEYLDLAVYQTAVMLANTSYTLRSINRTSEPLDVGRAEGTAVRFASTINGMAFLYEWNPPAPPTPSP